MIFLTILFLYRNTEITFYFINVRLRRILLRYFRLNPVSLNFIVTLSLLFQRCKNLCVEKTVFVISPIKHWHCGEVMACPCFVCVYKEPWNNMVVINYVKPYSLPSFLTHSSNWKNEKREVWNSITYFGEKQQHKL